MVANARDGSLQLFDGSDYKSTGRIELGSDADSVRIDDTAKRVVVGYGGGALAVLDPQTRGKVADIPLKAHPESFQIGEDSGRIFVNLPGARSVAVIDRSSEKQVTTWPMEQGGNYAMTLDRARPDSPGVSQLVEACGFRDDGRQAGLDDRDLRRSLR